jgi:hypothetical protein
VVVTTLFAAACQGEWRVTSRPSPVRAVHVALLHTGKVLLVAGSGNSRVDFDAGTFETTLWDPATESFQPVDTPWDAFCAGHAFLPDGRLLVAGGNSAYPGPATNNANAGLRDAYVFDPASSSYVRQPDMGTARWYPSVVELGSGNLFTVAGLDESGLRTNTSQIFNGTSWSADKAPPPQLNFMPMYPALHLMRDGRLFYSGSNVFGAGGASPGIWNFTTNEWKAVPGLSSPGRRDQSMSVLLPPAQDQRVMIMGGGHQDQAVAAVASTAIVDLDDANPAYTAGPPMEVGKMYVSAVLLPDSTVFQTGGASTTIHNGDHPVYSSQIYDPKTNTWKKAAAHKVPRSYHSSAMLLPDGRVATFGGNPEDRFEMQIEVYKPPYLQTDTPRPTISDGPTEIALGGTYSLATEQAAPIRSAVLVRPAAVSHSSDPNQRLVDLPFTPTGNGVQLSVTGNQNLAPPGWYMLFVVDGNGVPSVAKWVHLSN